MTIGVFTEVEENAKWRSDDADFKDFRRCFSMAQNNQTDAEKSIE
jgi:hypothetical protein